MIRSLAWRAAVRGRVATEVLRAHVVASTRPGVRVTRGARLGRGCTVDVAPGGSLLVDGTAVGAGTVIQVAPGATMQLRGRYIGPRSVLVARESVTVHRGAMLAEMVVVRDADHVREADGAISQTLYSTAPVVIGPEAWVASGARVLKGVVIGEAATVAAGAVVVRSVLPASVVGGVPARRLDSGP